MGMPADKTPQQDEQQPATPPPAADTPTAPDLTDEDTSSKAPSAPEPEPEPQDNENPQDDTPSTGDTSQPLSWADVIGGDDDK